MAQYDDAFAEEAMVINILNSIADKFNCKVDIDLETHEIEFHCKDEDRLAIAAELDKYFGDV